MEEKKISVIVPVYNAERFILRCADSILNQTYKNIELILVNDGSKDNSLSLCRQIAEKDSRVVVLDKPNGGAASARNMGLRYATGDYIGFCDADDYLDLDMYATLLEILQERNLSMVDCTSKCLTEDGIEVCKDADDGTLNICDSETAIKNVFRRTGNVHLATKLMRKEIAEGLTIPEGRRVEDFYFTILLLLRQREYAVINRAFYNYTISSGSVTRSGGGSIYLDAIFFYEKAVQELKKHNLSFPVEQEYYLFKMYYLLFISLNAAQWKKYHKQMREYKKHLQKNVRKMCKNPYLLKKEKAVLLLGCVFMRLPALAYGIKNMGKSK